MGNQNLITSEYETLREEILQSKKYVFERPLLIITLSLALIRFSDEPFLNLLLFTAVGLLTFNMWFTANRIKSITRISAYIQLELEERKHGKWIGWETCLREYRIITQHFNLKPDEALITKMKNYSIPKAQGYYNSIFYMHVFVVLFATIISIVISFNEMSALNFIYTILTLLLFILFVRIAILYNPNKMMKLIEEHRIIWEYVFNKMIKEGRK